MSTGAAPQEPGRGVRRKVDHLGRVVIPASMRRVLDIGDGDELEIRLHGETLQLAKPHETCAFCASDHDLTDVLGRPVCWSCVAAVRARGREGRS